ncbi:hypothetical protein ACFVAF_25105 [Streptomyces sp. NPDC057596]|uniref:hypothetical protein n=1 Tax=Streptomyces sp. NPDC057596 TaxID=3346178 RepID=UPI0036A05CA7
MRVRATAAGAALLLAALTACSSGGDKADSAAKPKPAASKPAASVDCSDESLSQADWMKHCADKAGTGGDGTEGMATGLKFGESYTWPDGLKVTVVDAKVFTDYDAEAYESAEPGKTDFRVKLKLENTGQAPADLGKLSTIVEGATNGGEAASSSFERGSEPLEGRLAPGVSATKTDDNVLETKYGRKVLVRVQRASDDFSLEFPEFTGQIAG